MVIGIEKVVSFATFSFNVFRIAPLWFSRCSVSCTCDGADWRPAAAAAAFLQLLLLCLCSWCCCSLQLMLSCFCRYWCTVEAAVLLLLLLCSWCAVAVASAVADARTFFQDTGNDLHVWCVDSLPSNTRHWTNIGSLLGRRRRRRANIEPTLVQCLVLYIDNKKNVADELLTKRWADVTRRWTITFRVDSTQSVTDNSSTTSSTREIVSTLLCHFQLQTDALWNVKHELCATRHVVGDYFKDRLLRGSRPCQREDLRHLIE